jgi:hypothetical protein
LPVRTLFTLYLLIIFAGIAFYLAVGLAHN